MKLQFCSEASQKCKALGLALGSITLSLIFSDIRSSGWIVGEYLICSVHYAGCQLIVIVALRRTIFALLDIKIASLLKR